VRHLRFYIPLLSLVECCAPFARAQSSASFMVGFGTAHNGANGGGIDDSTFAFCTPGTVTSSGGNCLANPSLGGFFLGFGGDVMLFKHIGIGGEIQTQPARGTYGPLEYRQTFYDVNAIFAPVNNKRVRFELQGGIGGARTSFAINQSYCVGTAVCSSETVSVGNANHFQAHFGAGLSLFVTEHIFVRPQFDLRIVPGFTDQFNSTVVPAGTVWVGYNFGER